MDRTRLLDSGDEERFDRLTRLAQQSFGVLSAVISLIGDDRQFLKSFVGPPFVRFYAGLPLRGPGGWFVGSMCILDTEPRILGREDRTLLQCLAQEAELELNRGT
ncbi:GAF domain-containing protein [uncultured Arthrobacter sp.]|uniref:GAF domain-containing protein n=1 Tax=uncultured Arthrobacter sp. TaxID=114050 RepID=UPI002627EFDE|nr:GAF domain-containing protein [uncultured Arthrobacter sp.]